MRLVADDDVDGRRAEKSVVFDIPALPREQRVARGDEAGEVGHRRAGDERAGDAGRQLQQVPKPVERDVLEHCCGRRHHAKRRVLIPGRGQDVCGKCGGHGAAVHEPEVAPAGVRHRARGAEVIEQREHAGRVGWTGRHVTAERVQRVDVLGCGADAPIADPIEVSSGACRRLENKLASSHGSSLLPGGDDRLQLLEVIPIVTADRLDDRANGHLPPFRVRDRSTERTR